MKLKYDIYGLTEHLCSETGHPVPLLSAACVSFSPKKKNRLANVDRITKAQTSAAVAQAN